MAFEGPVSLIPRLSILLAAVLYMAVLYPGSLYTGGLATANAQALDAETRAELEDLREGDLRKLTLHAAPRPAGAAAFTGRDGAEHTLADSNGKVRLLNFWATWCAPCRIEKPSLDALAAELTSPDFEVIAVASGRHELDAIDRFNAEVGVEHLATYIDPTNALAMEMAVPGLPVTVLLNREGEEIARLMGGADWDSPSARAIIDRVIALP
jgi:thiol-disulfide isomerase/thioredoxin